MTRDPLCTNGHGDALTADCSLCDLIAKVRADQQEKDRQKVDALFPADLPNLSWVGYGQGIVDATEALSAT
jgi:hypothetical protein